MTLAVLTTVVTLVLWLFVAYAAKTKRHLGTVFIIAIVGAVFSVLGLIAAGVLATKATTTTSTTTPPTTGQ